MDAALNMDLHYLGDQDMQRQEMKYRILVHVPP